MGIRHNFSAFFARYQAEVKKWDERKRRVVRGVALQCLADLQKESPVLTGRYRAGHTLTIGEETDWQPHELSSAERNTIAQANESAMEKQPHEDYRRIAEENLDDAMSNLLGLKIRGGVLVLIQNNVEYGPYVEARDHVYAIVEQRYDSILRRELRKA